MGEINKIPCTYEQIYYHFKKYVHYTKVKFQEHNCVDIKRVTYNYNQLNSLNFPEEEREENSYSFQEKVREVETDYLLNLDSSEEFVDIPLDLFLDDPGSIETRSISFISTIEQRILKTTSLLFLDFNTVGKKREFFRSNFYLFLNKKKKICFIIPILEIS